MNVEQMATMLALVLVMRLSFAQGEAAKPHPATTPAETEKALSLKWIDFRFYPSSQDPSLRLAATFHKPDKPSPILIEGHGWHGSIAPPDPKADRPTTGYFRISVDMRGRKYSTGKPDASGWELQDWVDAAEFAKTNYPEYISDKECVYVMGGSGGGGNVYAIVGKFPDYFAAAFASCGMSDYALWYRGDEKVGEFRDEMEGKGWIGGSTETNPEGYQSRGGLTTVGNLLTPLLTVHAEKDIRVPVDHARLYAEKAKSLGKPIEYIELPGVGGRGHFDNITKEQSAMISTRREAHFRQHTRPPELPAKGRMVVAGYLKTKRFEVIWPHIDRIGSVDYALEQGRWTFTLLSDSANEATLNMRVPGKKLADFAIQAVCDGQNALTKSEIHGDWLRLSLVLHQRAEVAVQSQ